MSLRFISRYILPALLIAGFSTPAFAVTKEEMEKARATSAKIYLRWANNGSGYLDQVSASSISELEGKIHGKEKENIKAFKAIALPSGYEQWDKAKLVEYWSATALASSGLNADGIRPGAKKAIAAALNKMSVSAPAPEPVAEEPAPAAETTDAVIPAEEAQAIAEQEAAEQQLADSALLAADSTAANAKRPMASNNTWIYIVALALLVLAVVALVVYASKTMRKQNADGSNTPGAAPEQNNTRRQEEDAPDPTTSESRPSRRRTEELQSDYDRATAAASDDTGRLREKFADSLARKQEEIRILNRQILDLTNENNALSEQNTSLRLDNDRLRVERDDLERRLTDAAASRAERPAAPPVQRPGAEPSRSATSDTTAGQPREIYLGRVNNRGLFVRADRTFNPGNSVYLLRTSDGFSGSFRVVQDESVFDNAFIRPEEFLSGGCVAPDITDTAGRTNIITESAGTAIFENNCWRVIRKAKIRFE